MRYYQIDHQTELRQMLTALNFFDEWAELIRESSHDWDYLKKYYRGILDPRKKAAVDFRALFFALRIQPVLSFIEDFIVKYQRAPYILDLGCGFGMESLLLCRVGAHLR